MSGASKKSTQPMFTPRPPPPEEDLFGVDEDSDGEDMFGDPKPKRGIQKNDMAQAQHLYGPDIADKYIAYPIS